MRKECSEWHLPMRAKVKISPLMLTFSRDFHVSRALLDGCVSHQILTAPEDRPCTPTPQMKKVRFRKGR